VRVASARLRVVLAGLLVVSAALFAVGSTLERHREGGHANETAVAERHSETAAESGSESPGGSTETGHRSETETRLLGVDTESVGLEVAAIVLSLGVAIAVWVSRQRAVVVAVVALGLIFAAGDVRELVHQLSESRPGLAAIAALLIGVHLAVAAVAAVLAVRHAHDTAPMSEATG